MSSLSSMICSSAACSLLGRMQSSSPSCHMTGRANINHDVMQKYTSCTKWQDTNVKANFRQQHSLFLSVYIHILKQVNDITCQHNDNMHRENITPLLPTKHSTCKEKTSAGKAIPTLGPHPPISLRTEMCTHLNNKLVCTQIHYEHLEISVRQLQTEDFTMSYKLVKSVVTRWSLWTKKRPR